MPQLDWQWEGTVQSLETLLAPAGGLTTSEAAEPSGCGQGHTGPLRTCILESGATNDITAAAPLGQHLYPLRGPHWPHFGDATLTWDRTFPPEIGQEAGIRAPGQSTFISGSPCRQALEKRSPGVREGQLCPSQGRLSAGSGAHGGTGLRV